MAPLREDHPRKCSVCLDDLISQAISQPANASAPPTLSPWQSLSDTPLDYSTALAFKGALLVVGGGDRSGSTAIYHYQPSSRSWIKAGEMPTGRFKCTCTVLPSGDRYVASNSYGHSTIQPVDIPAMATEGHLLMSPDETGPLTYAL